MTSNTTSELNLMPMELQDVIPKDTKSDPRSLAEWTHVLINQEMPILSYTALSIHDVLNDDRKGAMELASVILQDPNLTVKLLKISNTPHYNPTRQKIVTVSRAITMIGSEVIRELTLICSFLESISSSINKQKVSEEIAQAIHAAIHAKYLAVASRDPSPEEVFIATLLKNIGSISFWCFCRNQGERIKAIVDKGEVTQAEAEKIVLGFKLVELGANLSKAWNLGGLIEESIKPATLSKNPRIGLINLGYEITEALRAGIDSKKYETCIRKIESLTGQPKQIIHEKLKENTRAASDIAYQFGATDAAKLIQNVLSQAIDSEGVLPVIDKKHLQLQITQDITSIISEQFDINLLLKTIIEGIHRGIGMDRTILSMLVHDKQILRERFSLGWRKEIYEDKVIFNVSEKPDNLFHHVLSGNQAFWAKPSEHASFYTRHDINVIGKNECFMMPIFSNKIPVGLIYADREKSKEPLTEEDFNAFKSFTQLANMGFTVYRLQSGMDLVKK